MEEKQGNKYGSRRPGTLWFFVFLFNKVAGSFPTIIRSSHPVVFLEKGVLKICSNVRGEHPCRSVISIKLQSDFVEITLRHGCFPVNFLHIFRKPFSKNTSGWLLLNYYGRTSSWIFDKKIYTIFFREFITQCPWSNSFSILNLKPNISSNITVWTSLIQSNTDFVSNS